MASDGGMKITCSVNLHGLEQDLKEVGPKIGRRLFRKALKSVGQLWVEDLKFRVPVDEGDLRESIAASVTVRNKGKLTVGAVTCGPSYDKTSPRHGSGRTENPGIYGLFVEFGLKKKLYKFTPFMRPTFDTTAERMVQVFADGLREDLEAALKD